MGRRPLAEEAKTEKQLRIRVTRRERTTIEAAAEVDGKPFSTWARDVLLETAEKILSETKAGKTKAKAPKARTRAKPAPRKSASQASEASPLPLPSCSNRGPSSGPGLSPHPKAGRKTARKSAGKASGKVSGKTARSTSAAPEPPARARDAAGRRAKGKAGGEGKAR